jgi:hypothetical protein
VDFAPARTAAWARQVGALAIPMANNKNDKSGTQNRQKLLGRIRRCKFKVTPDLTFDEKISLNEAKHHGKNRAKINQEKRQRRVRKSPNDLNYGIWPFPTGLSESRSIDVADQNSRPSRIHNPNSITLRQTQSTEDMCLCYILAKTCDRP